MHFYTKYIPLSALLLTLSPAPAAAHQLLPPAIVWHPARTTIAEQIARLERQHSVRFVYDAQLPLAQTYNGPSLHGLTLKEALRKLFDGTGIDFDIRREYVMLKKAKAAASHRQDNGHGIAKPAASRIHQSQPSHTLSGYVRTEGDESLIHATVRDLTTGLATTTNEHGFFSLTMPEGHHQLRTSYIGMADCDTTLMLRGDRQLSFLLHSDAQLQEVVVEGDGASPMDGTQTGRRTLTSRDIMLPFSAFSSPDVVKVLQRMSGVAEGTEMASGLYVHGGGQDENLMLLDGTPLYEINHSLGLFSAFNADAVKNVDFYKSGFPARYSGRLSSVVDVRTADGDMDRHHWSYRIGTLDGALNFQGPIGRRHRTAYNVSLRRSWLDLLGKPALAIYKSKHKDDYTDLGYFFHDFNAKFTHVVSDRTRLSLSLYSGMDKFSVRNYYRYSWSDDKASNYSVDDEQNRYSWGNLNAALQLNHMVTPQLFANFTAVYSRNFSRLNAQEDYSSYLQKKVQSRQYNESLYRSTINDGGLRAAFDYRPSPRHHIRFGSGYTLHVFRPQTQMQAWINGNVAAADSLINRSNNRHTGHEFSLWAEDEMELAPRLMANVGVSASLFGVDGKGFWALDPRLALKYQLSPTMAMKASMTQMTQYVHKLSNSYISLPTDYWVPTTRRLKPMRATQLALGLYAQPSRRWMLSVEGYYKWSRHLLQYAHWSSLVPPAESWDKTVMDGQGRYYGMEFDASYQGRKVALSMTYTLSWSQRRFDKFYPYWYYDKFDNRHKLTLTGRWTTSRHTEVYCSWMVHTGNRITLPTQLVFQPALPGSRPATKEGDYVQIQDGQWVKTIVEADPIFVYDRPNNYVLPLYHRLDLGFNWHKTTRKGHERIWNLSLYNAYSHMNPLYVEVNTNTTWRNERRTGAQLTAWGFIPIIPSVSYTKKF